MFSSENWRLEAVVRLVASVFISVCCGGLVLSLLHTLPRIPSGLFLVGVAGGLLCFSVALFLIHQPIQLERLVSRIAVIGCCFYVGLFLTTYTRRAAEVPDYSVMQMITSAVFLQGAILVLGHVFLRSHKLGWMEGFGLNRQILNALVLGLLAAFIFIPIGWALQWISTGLLQKIPYLELKPEEQMSVQILRTVNTTLHRVALGLTTVILAPVAEEVLFRGVLYRWIKLAGRPKLAMWGVALLFAFLHANLGSFVPLALFSILLTVLYDKTGNLMASITAHAVFNAANYILLFLMNQPVRPWTGGQ